MTNIIGEQKKSFITGNEAAAWASLVAGADVMFGYPITPQNEVMHYWTRLAPKYDRQFLQTEDEISAGFTVCGAVQAGKKAFTATAGPGNVLMQEPFGMAEAMRLPILSVIQQRGGPSSGTVIYSQQEVTLTCLGGNGEGHRIVYSTASHQEIYDYTIKGYNMAWKYRFPTFILGDGYQAKMREPLEMYNPEEKGIEMIKPYPLLGLDGKVGADRDPSHLCNIYSMEEELYDVVINFNKDFDEMAPNVIEYEENQCEDADIVIIAHGVVSRAADDAVKGLRAQGIKAGSFRPITLRPFPTQQLRDAIDKSNAKTILVAESAWGQLDRMIKYELYGYTTKIENLFKPGVGIVDHDIIDKIKSVI
ncbi:2-oxoglutarate/2-oxoacid ferredoxin oxidoreductase, alpha subunit [Candidatus Syntrophocurvum alkaliphilum]|uniref:2-oxoglutarate/2-oxoacid ferredoxin oxidoreductase, alpha subunit n=1 Tax=Candidatus Syntrophocurvum alkaliphilum TaxID=2293317 RepID=A0A6I6DDL2_9FIRM|nr:ferredoxin oxidoreductase [Candidatus Syntrophocurvum alkaliphilum]QGU00592.1 2-oxoglutarate/2-oxoacid ferredoxin oxidoreductase, alpha subunit [Candidatus Syntrophocurvum alkaliphilum]